MDVDRLRSSLNELAQRYRIPGAQLVVSDGRTTTALETGEREYLTGAPVTASDAFPLGSVTKACTATLAMQLVADRDLELDAPITEYVPELRGGRGDHFAGVTLRHLLSHTAGLVSNHELVDRDCASLRSYARDCARLAPLYPPGRLFSYSNTGYVLVGHLIEVASRQSWWEAVEEFLLGPLGIEPRYLTAVMAVQTAQAGRRAGPAVTGHTVRLARREVQPVDQYLPTTWAPAGGLAASASDLVKLARLHCGGPAGGGLLGAAELAEMHRPVAGTDPFGLADGWCLGWAHFQAGSTRWLGHDGTTDGATCNLRFDPASGATVALMTNATSGLLLWRDIVAVLADAGIPVGSRPALPQPAATPPAADCVGVYRNGELSWTVSMSGSDGLLMQDKTRTSERLSMLDDSVFVSERIGIDDAPALGRFVREPATGSIAGLQLSGRVFQREHGPARTAVQVGTSRGERR